MIGVLTYTAPHRRTEDVVFRLLMSGHTKLVAICVPWEQRPQHKRIYAHRPAEDSWPCVPIAGPKGLQRLGIECVTAPKRELASVMAALAPEVTVYCGGGLLPKEVVDRHVILNAHPGRLPEYRGLDALKWAVMECRPVVATCHILDEAVDLGWRIKESSVPVYHSDTFHAFAAREYELEQDLYVECLTLTMSRTDRIAASEKPPYRRMPRRVEAGLMEAFDRYKRVYAQ